MQKVVPKEDTIRLIWMPRTAPLGTQRAPARSRDGNHLPERDNQEGDLGQSREDTIGRKLYQKITLTQQGSPGYRRQRRWVSSDGFSGAKRGGSHVMIAVAMYGDK